MAAEKTIPLPPDPWPNWRVGLTALTVLALALSAYLAWHHLSGGSVIGCSGGSPCDQVLSGRWSLVGGVLPVSGLATGTYLAFLCASLSIAPTHGAPVRRLAWQTMLVLAGAITGSAAWFFIVQRWIVGAFCPYCVATHVTGLLVAGLVNWQAPKQEGDDIVEMPEAKTDPRPLVGDTSRRLIGARSAFGLNLAGVALTALMAAGQVFITPSIVYRDGASQKSLPALDPNAAPLVGSPKAHYVVNLLFDYACPHCQRLHFQLEEAVRRYHGELAFALCPSPLNSQCNPYVARDSDQFKDSCELTKIALAVWLAKREVFADFNLWMFSHESGALWHPRSIDAAKAKAIELVGPPKFDAARTNPWINQYLQATIRLFGDTAQGSSAVPKLVYGSQWVVPEVRDADDLISILQDSLKVPKP